ncbi:MAG: CCA tRNA nucleotidyltransferase, partial [Deltaproteobacteria bacterium]|nr:CCA tRNA nucleotidyltransferase [Deltaproteobacteria bacterium]
RPRQVRRLFPQVIEVGIAFGVVRVRLPDELGTMHEVEVATFRADGEYLDGRRPESVRFTDAEQDVLRRDFTINGLLLDPLRDRSTGMVVDWVGGMEDLRLGRLRAIGDARLRFGEDALRLLRAPRFAARFGLHIEESTRLAIVELAPTLRRVAAERITTEVGLMLTAPSARLAIELLQGLGLCDALWPTLSAAPHHWPQVAERAERLRATGGVDLPLALANLAYGVAGWLASSECETSLRLSRAERNLALAIHAAAQWVEPLGPPRPGPWHAEEARWLRRSEADAALRLCQAAEPDGPYAAWRTHLAAADPQWLWPQHPVTGDELQRHGHRPGPHFKIALAAAEAVQLEGGGRAQALDAAELALARQGQA